MMDIITTIFIGFFAGLVGRALHPGKDDMGILLTALLGIGGAFIGKFLGSFFGLYAKGSVVSFILSVVGAIIILFVYGQVVKIRNQSQGLPPPDQQN